MNNFQLTMPTTIFYGKGMVKKISKPLSQFNRILLISGSGSIKKNGIYDDVMKVLEKCRLNVEELWGVRPNPDIELVREGVRLCRTKKIDFIIAVGGGSVIDTAKAIACGFYHEGDPWELYYDESKVKKALPLGVILTLSATGSETNGNSVVSNRETGEKLAVHNDILRPKFAVLDPEYTVSVSPIQTAAGSVDIMAHVFEQYFSNTKTAPMIDRISEQIVKTVILNAPRALENPADVEARGELMYASTLALNGLLSSGKITDWATHAMEHEVSATHDITHGIGLAILFPQWMRYCYDEQRAWKYGEFANNIWGISHRDKKEEAFEAIQKTQDFFSSLGIPLCFNHFNIQESIIDTWTDSIVKRRKSIGNFKVLFEGDIRNIYKMAFC